MKRLDQKIALLLFLASASTGTGAPVSAPAWAGETPADLAALRAEALTKNPSLAADRRAYEAAKGRVFENWLFEDPMFGADVEGQEDLFDFDGRANAEYMVQQDLPSPVEWVLKGLSAGKEAEAAFQRWREAQWKITRAVEGPYQEWLRAKKSEAILVEMEHLLEELSRAAKSRYEAGQGDQTDVLAAEIELAKAKIERIRENRNATVAEAELARALGRDLSLPADLADAATVRPYGFSFEQLARQALENRPELRALFAESQKAGLDRDRVLWNWVPETKLRYEGRQFPGESSIREHDTFIGLSVPVWSVLGGLGGSWGAARAQAESVRRAYEDFRNQVRLEVHHAHSRAFAAAQTIQIYEAEILPQARQRVRTALAAYEAGRSDFLGVVDAERTLKESELGALRERAEYEIALSDLKGAIGGELPPAKESS